MGNKIRDMWSLQKNLQHQTLKMRYNPRYEYIASHANAEKIGRGNR
jgi:hypothetical protein